MNPIDITIDKLTNSIENSFSGDSFDTLVIKIKPDDYKIIQSQNWNFDWITEEKKNNSVYKLVVRDNLSVIQGLISLADGKEFIDVKLVESAPFNQGILKAYRGVGGNLFAFACKTSKDLGYNGLVSFVAKTNLLHHYTQKIGALQVGNSLQMIIYEDTANILIKKYFN